jgi:hypothetical protein
MTTASFTDGWYADAVSAYEAWAEAASNVPNGGLRFRYVKTCDARGDDIVIRFVSAASVPGFQGYTREYGDWALVSVVVEAEPGERARHAYVRRVIMHELGHALGIWGHSPNPGDVMSEDPSPARVSIADVNTLRLAYRAAE